MLHGAAGSSTQLEPLAKMLENKFQIYLMNFLGHGGKEIPEEKFSIRLFAEDIRYFVEKNKLEGIDIYGYSMGGYAALYAAFHYPGLVNRIFTTATKFDWNENTALKESAMLNPESIEEKVPAFAKKLMQRHAPGDWKKILMKTAEMMIELGKNPELSFEDVSKIENKILLSVGDRDSMVSIEETTDVYRKMKNGSLLILPQTPHPIEKISVNRLAFEIENFFLG